jgi:hypothetical protein
MKRAVWMVGWFAVWVALGQQVTEVERWRSMPGALVLNTVTLIPTTNGSVELRWPRRNDRRYMVEWSPALNWQFWPGVEGVWTWGADVMHFQPARPLPGGFWRVWQLPDGLGSPPP